MKGGVGASGDAGRACVQGPLCLEQGRRKKEDQDHAELARLCD